MRAIHTDEVAYKIRQMVETLNDVSLTGTIEPTHNDGANAEFAFRVAATTGDEFTITVTRDKFSAALS
jgi:hypothetical protein